jgi:hypothetical protein
MLFTTTAPWLYEKFGYEPVNRENYAWTITRLIFIPTEKAWQATLIQLHRKRLYR